jgi:calcineurin-like phosphoesterase family protein
MSGSTWVASDPHFSHANILTFKREDGTLLRPFKDIEEHDETLISNWNSVVATGDRVYLLGDVAFHPRVFHSVIPRLNGRICLVPGNHEPPKMRKYFDLFDDVRGYVVKKGYIMSHIPIHPGSLSRWSLNIHGHLHANNVTIENTRGEIDYRYFNASMEQINFTPKLLDDILKERDIT